MMTRKLLTTGALALAIAMPALANDIYKYVDEDGTVHYVDRPTGVESEERVAFVARSRTANSSSTDNSGPDWRERRESRQEAQRAAEEEASQQAEREKLCQESRDRLQQYNQARRLYRTDEQGERVYLDEEQIQEARQKVADLIEEHCNG
ncbi:MAG: DUF4124 domain-containing protein [Woeseiaceae bacterium]|nr:DUF4124 domain-containing protein [Woeseiaceae bacterium]